MTYGITWDVTSRFDPNSLTPNLTHGIPIPSYGNYGGPNYSAGQKGGRTPEPNPTTGLPTPPPIDALDYLFWQHDLAYQHYEDNPSPATQQEVFKADLKLVEDMFTLTQPSPSNPNYALFTTHPEALLYEGVAALAIGGKVSQ
jgi:hypothetical protein